MNWMERMIDEIETIHAVRGTIIAANVQVRMLSVNELHESPRNPRQHYPEAAMAQLIESMRTSGFRQWLPIVVRPDPSGEGYEIAAGHRRRRAAFEAGVWEVPCVVRTMSDEEFLEVLNFDNSAREDVHPLDEAAGWQAWMHETGKGVLDIAARIGQSKEYVYQRLKYASLIEDARKAFLGGEISAGHAILIARLPRPSDQKVALKFASGPEWMDASKKPGVRELAQFISRDLHLDLERACFDLADPTLLTGGNTSGSCDACPKRSTNTPDFAVLDEALKRDTCMDPGCFSLKVSAHLVRIKTRLEDEGKKPVSLSSTYGKPKKSVDYTRGDVQITTSATPGALLAIWIDGPDVGKVVYVKPLPKQTPSASDGASSSSRSASSSTVSRMDPAAAKLAEENRLAKFELERTVRRKIFDEVRARVKDVSRVDLEFLLCDSLMNIDSDELERTHGAAFAKLWNKQDCERVLAKLSDAEIYQLAVELPLLDDLEEYRITDEAPPTLLLAAAKRYKVDAAKLRKEIESGGADAPKPTAATAPPAKKAAAPAAKKKAAAPVKAKAKVPPPVKKAAKTTAKKKAGKK